MKKILLITLLLIYGCGTTEFFEYDNDEIQFGKGCFKESERHGIVLCSQGIPKDKKCKTIGMLRDSRSGDDSTWREKSVFAKAVEKKANVILKISENSNYSGSVPITSFNTYGKNTSTITYFPISETKTEYVIFKCE